MPYTGVVKSIGKEYGFIECAQTFALYQRDAFLNKALMGENIYYNLSMGERIGFDVTEDQKGQPQAVNVTQSGKGGAPKGKGGFAPSAGKGKGGGGGGGGGMNKPDWMPADAQPVTLYNKPGWFVSQESINAQAYYGGGAVLSSRKRAAPDMGGAGTFAKKPAQMGQFSVPSTPNPGLDMNEQVFQGAIKHPPNPNTGYGFVQEDTISQMYGGKDAFLHIKHCPWAQDMNLQVGDMVQFNVIEDEKGNPQVTRVTKV
jgi:cold shock CspA family protein